MLSIIIPAYNEEKYLPLLLESIKKQSFKDYEIIVADGSSEDNTVKIAKRYGCRIVKEPVNGHTPSSGKNKGAKAAKGGLILILESDVVLPENFLSEFLDKFRSEKLDYSTCMVKSSSGILIHRLFFMIKNYSNLFACLFYPHVSGQCILIRKSLYNKIKGFDDSLYLGEEHDLAKRAAKHGKWKFFIDMFVYCSPRRVEKEGFLKIISKGLLSELYRLFIGPITHDNKIYEYRKGHF